MKLRKKLAVSTIAASVALTAFAGIPLSSQGLAEKLGVSGVAYADSALEESTLEADVEALYDALVATGGLKALEALQVAFENLSLAAADRITAPVVDKLVTAGIEKDDLQALFFEAVILYYNPSEEGLEQLRADHSAFIQSFAENVNVDLTVDDIAQYFFDIQAEFFNQLGDKSLTELLALMTNSSALNNLLENVLGALPEDEYAVEQVFLQYGITTEDVIKVLLQVRTEIGNDSLFINAATALFTAYDSLNTETTPPPPPGGELAPPPATIEISKEAADLAKKLNGLKGSIANATGEEKAKLIDAAVKEATALATKLSVIENTITTVNGKAVLKLDENKALSAIAGIGAIMDGLKAAAPGATLPKIKVTIDLGNVSQDGVAIGLSNNIMAQAIKANLAAITIKVGGLSVDLPVGGTFSSAIDFQINKSDATKEVTRNLKSASKVYDFNISIGGVATTKFDQPIIVSIPLGDTAGMDKELLSIAKIVDGKLQFQGGRIVNGQLVESRDSFSSYVVVENKVTFKDTASVEAWAGRSIQVVAAKGAIVGKSEGEFAPQDKVTRAEFAKMLIRALDLDNGSAKESFADVSASDWHAPYVAAAAGLKIINGRSASKFDPNAKITRAEMATMIARALKVTNGAADVADVNAALKGFADAGKISATLKGGVAFAAANQIVIGNAGKFLPNNNATRAEAAVIIYRALNFDN